MKCAKCDNEYNGKFCNNCGEKAYDFCQNCNTTFEGKFCSECGYSPTQPQQPYQNIEQPQYQQPQYQQPQYQQPQYQQPQIIINNMNGALGLRGKNKWAAFFLCLFLGVLGAHKFYEGKILLGIVYLLTFGLFGIGTFIDFFILLFKPNPYYV